MQQRGRVGLREVSSCARLERIDIVAHPSIQPPSRLSMAPVLASVVVVARCASRSVVRAIAVHRREVEARLRSWRRGRVAMGHWRRREIVRDHLVQSVRSSTQVRDRERVTTSNNPSCMLHAYIWYHATQSQRRQRRAGPFLVPEASPSTSSSLFDNVQTISLTSHHPL